MENCMKKHENTICDKGKMQKENNKKTQKQ